MYARQVSMELKPDSRKDFTHKIEAEILPLPVSYTHLTLPTITE